MSVTPSADLPADTVSAQRWARLEAFAAKHGLSLDAALRRAIDIADVILDAKAMPGTEIYAFRNEKRYRLDIFPLDPQ